MIEMLSNDSCIAVACIGFGDIAHLLNLQSSSISLAAAVGNDDTVSGYTFKVEF